MRIHQGLGRQSFPRKLDRLLGEFEFGPIKQVIGGLLTSLQP
jgi:hypothetical protein